MRAVSFFFAFGAYSRMVGLCGPLVVLLCGGDKSSQEWDIALAKTIAAQWMSDHDGSQI